MTALAVLSLGASASGAALPDIIFAGICDGSAAVAVDADSFIAAYDERDVLTVYGSDGMKGGQVLDLDGFLKLPPQSESDIEGGARLAEGHRIFWISSHGRRGGAIEAPERLRFFATAWGNDGPVPSGVARSDLLAAGLADDGWLGLGLKTASTKAPEDVGDPPGVNGGLNIEGLAAGPGRSLYIGFRSPLFQKEGAAIVLPLLNPDDVVDDVRTVPAFGTPIRLPLDGRGIRSIDRMADGSYRVIAGSADDTANFALYSWDGKVTDGVGKAVKLAVGFGDLSPESLVELAPGKLLLLSDDGDRKKDENSKRCKKLPPSEQAFRGRIFP